MIAPDEQALNKFYKEYEALLHVVYHNANSLPLAANCVFYVLLAYASGLISKGAMLATVDAVAYAARLKKVVILRYIIRKSVDEF